MKHYGRVIKSIVVLLVVVVGSSTDQDQETEEVSIEQYTEAVKEKNLNLHDGLETPSDEPRARRVKRPDAIAETEFPEVDVSVEENAKAPDVPDPSLTDNELIEQLMTADDNDKEYANAEIEAEPNFVSADGFENVDADDMDAMMPDVSTSTAMFEQTEDELPTEEFDISEEAPSMEVEEMTFGEPPGDIEDTSVLRGEPDEYVPPPKVKEIPQPGTEQLVAAEKILGLTGKSASEPAGSRPNYRKAYSLLYDAAELGNKKAKVLLANAHLQGANTPYVEHNLTRAYELLSSAAEVGLPPAQQLLGAIFATGLGVNSSQSKALLYYTFSALGGNSLAQMSLAYRYWSGVSVAQSCESALKYYSLVADHVAKGIDNLGVGPIVVRIRLMEEDQFPRESPMLDDDLVQYYQFLADKGDLQAQLGLGTLHLNGGRGIERNLKLAHHYFYLAAKAGNTNAYGYLGKISLLNKDYATALKYFKLSSKDPMGQWGLGTMYYHGWSVKQDYKQAMTYFMGAANEGNAEAELQLAQMYLNGIGVKKDQGVALKHFNMASKQGHVLAFYNLGMMHANGVGVMRNCQTAAELLKNVAERGPWSSDIMSAHAFYHKGHIDAALVKYLLLAELGYEVAQANAAYILDREESDFITLLKHRYKRAFVNWKRSASQGFGGARLKLGDYYYYGQGIDKDTVEAAEQYELASNVDNNPQALFNLGYMHEQGIGKQQDVYLAKRYYDRASDASPDAHIPVFLANTKLQAKIYFNSLEATYQDLTLTKMQDKVYSFVTSTSTSAGEAYQWTSEALQNLESFGGQDWDIYMMSVLAILLGIIMAIRNHNIRAAQLRQQQQQQ